MLNDENINFLANMTSLSLTRKHFTLKHLFDHIGIYSGEKEKN